MLNESEGNNSSLASCKSTADRSTDNRLCPMLMLCVCAYSMHCFKLHASLLSCDMAAIAVQTDNIVAILRKFMII